MDNKVSFRKEISLVVFGAVLGGVVTLIAGCWTEATHRAFEKDDAANLLLAFVDAQSKMNNSLIKFLKESLKGGQSMVQVSSPEGFKWAHDPTVARGLYDKIG